MVGRLATSLLEALFSVLHLFAYQCHNMWTELKWTSVASELYVCDSLKRLTPDQWPDEARQDRDSGFGRAEHAHRVDRGLGVVRIGCPPEPFRPKESPALKGRP